MSSPQGLPVLDFSAFYGEDPKAKAKLVEQVWQSCVYNGFFQITGHRILWELQQRAVGCSKRFFCLPLEEKFKIDKKNNTFNRGYELQSQMNEAGASPDLKEGLYIGREISTDHPYFLEGLLNSGPNQWPGAIPDPEFQQSTIEYYHAVFDLAKDTMAVLALTMNHDETYFHSLTDGAVATLRYLHYPPQPKVVEERLRGIAAHTDFSCITLLLQDEVDGLQVLDMTTSEWIDVQPIRGAYVVNLGNLFSRMTNEVYKSNLHRVINSSGNDRYSIPFFFTGSPGFVCRCLPGFREHGGPGRYPPATVQEVVSSSYKETFARAARYKAEMQEKLQNRAAEEVAA
ncbi:oxidoreductase [Aspergillus bombycis]|uniref:Oxidoreductase n=1 Tax=Aspergillus bombycis TaxID=109264 RepID=A0A1F7ZNS2_9EURO|nr:oxidoreductase [Aspergillus bombycis]OGM41100.1 oxidoreductase [Aspergillus bombycis]